MQTAVERVMQTYGLMVSLTAEQEREARERVSRFLEDKTAIAAGDAMEISYGQTQRNELLPV